MKELSIEEKAKRYDEAIEIAREWSETKNGYYMPKELCEEIFPELRESDDERIRKAISDILLIDNDEIRDILDANNVLMQDIDAWLEKQYADPIKEYWRGYNEGKQCVLDKYAELEKQGEQKPVEWSEEDDILLNDTIYTIKEGERFENELKHENCHDSHTYQVIISWLKSLKNRVQPQPKQEWSEWDEDKFRDVIRIIEQGEPVQSMRDHYTDWLKSLKPQNK